MDRAKARDAAEVGADIAERERRLEALKELARNPETGEVDMELVIQQSKAFGGDVKSTHLVKGLDFALLQRVKKGEDVMGLGAGGKGGVDTGKEEDCKDDDRLEVELDKALDKAVVPVEKERVKKSGKKVTREEMLAELKRQKMEAAASKAAAAQPAPLLDSRFKKIGQPKEKKKIEKPRKKMDKLKTKMASAPLGMLLPALPLSKEAQDEGDEIDIFEGVGVDYDPLAGLEDDDDSNSSDDDRVKQRPSASSEKKQSEDEAETKGGSMPPPPRPKPNYFNETEEEEERYPPHPTSASALLAQNPDLAAALAKAAKLAPKLESTAEELEKVNKRKVMLENFDRDAMDMDMGFGGSRDWGEDEEEYVESSKGKKRKRNRGAKKGDKNDADLVSKIAAEKYGKQ